MAVQHPASLLEVLRRLAPGTLIREGLELILLQGTGALIVLGWDSKVDALCTGGFALRDTHFTPARLAELAKMDAAIVVNDDTDRIMRANVHLIPDPAIPTSETGTRHRTAERMALQTGKPVVAVSEGRSLAIVYTPDGSHAIESPDSLLPRANQAILTLERFRRRLDGTEALLTRSEVEDSATIRGVVTIIQRAELVRRIAAESEEFTVALGGAGNLIRLQSADLTQGVRELGDVVIRDYAKARRTTPRSMDDLADISTEDLYDPEVVANRLKLGDPDELARPRGYRVLGGIPRLPDSVKVSLVDHFGNLQKMLRATEEELAQVEGVGKARAAQLRSYFDHLLYTTSQWEQGFGA